MKLVPENNALLDQFERKTAPTLYTLIQSLLGFLSAGGSAMGDRWVFQNTTLFSKDCTSAIKHLNRRGVMARLGNRRSPIFHQGNSQTQSEQQSSGA